MMKPKALTEHEEGMLEYLEDIVGSSRFKEPIEEVAKEVEDLNEVRGEKVWTYSISVKSHALFPWTICCGRPFRVGYTHKGGHTRELISKTAEDDNVDETIRL